jgi:hypothetical protein
MTKKVEDIKNTFVSIGKALPLLIGGTAGLFITPRGAVGSPVKLASQGYFEQAWVSTLKNYAFMDEAGQFHADMGTGVKALAAGGIISKLLSWAME